MVADRNVPAPMESVLGVNRAGGSRRSLYRHGREIHPVAEAQLERIEATMVESAMPPERLSVYFGDSTDDFADRIISEGVRQNLRANSRKIFLNDACTNHGCFVFGIHTIGSTGPELNVVSEKQLGRQSSNAFGITLSAEEREYLEWEWFYFQQEIDLSDHLRQAIEALQYDGEMFFQLVFDPEISRVNLNLLQIEAKRVRYPMQGPWNEQLVEGIEFEGMHPKTYYVQKKVLNPNLDFAWTFEPIPADQILHFVVKRLPDQHRGMSWLSCVLNDLAETHLYDQYHLGAANAAARNSGGVVELDASLAYEPGDPIDLDGITEMDAPNPGMIKQLLPGMKYVQGSAQWPCGSYDTFINSKHKKHAAGMNLTKAMLTNDFSDHNYSSFRGEMIVYWEVIRYIRSRLERLILDKLFDHWISCLSCVDEKVAEIVSRHNGNVKRIPRSWSWSPIPAFDMKDLIASLQVAVSAGFMSRKMAVQALGKDFEQVEQERIADTFQSVNGEVNENQS